MTRRRKALFALAAAALLALGAEAALRFVPGLTPPAKPFFRLDDGSLQFRLAKTDASFRDPKPDNTFRVFCVGGSATEGSIYNPKSSFSKLLREMLTDASRGQAVEVINLGVTAKKSDDVLDIFRAALDHQPDLMVVYCGNNDFAEYRPVNRAGSPVLYSISRFLSRHSRIYYGASAIATALWWTAADTGIAEGNTGDGPGTEIYTDERRREILSSFRLNLAEMAEAAKESGVPVLFSTVAINLKDWPPVRDFRGAKAGFDEGRRRLDAGDTDGAMEKFLRAAEDNDDPLRRARPSINTVIMEVAAERKLPVVDIFAEFNRHSPGGIAGFELIDDYCHPSLDGQALIASGLAERVSADYPGQFRPLGREDLFARRGEYLARLGIENDFIARRLQEMAFYLAFGFDHPATDGQALRLLGKQKEILPDSSLRDAAEGLLALRRGDRERARQAFERALRETPDHFAKVTGLYFTRFMRLDPPWLFVRADATTDFTPILADYLARRQADIRLQTEDATSFYRADGARLSDFSIPVLQKIAERKPSARAPLTIFPSSAPLKTAGIRAEGNAMMAETDARLYFGGLTIAPDRTASASVVLDIMGEPPPGSLCLYWLDSSMQDFGEDHKACSADSLRTGEMEYNITLSDRPDWFMNRLVNELRLDPGEGRIKFQLKEFRLNYF